MSDKELNVLTDEDIVAMAQEGSNRAYEFLIGKYRELAKVKARKYYISGAEIEDVVQEGMIGIFKAIRDFNPEAGTSFSTFLHLCVDRQIMTAVTGANREKHSILNDSISLSGVGSDEDSGESGEGPIIPDIATGRKDDPGVIAVNNDALTSILNEGAGILSPMEKKVWEGMLKGKDYREIAEDMKKPPKSVDNAIQRIKKKMRNEFSIIDILTE